MNDYEETGELPELSDDAIRLLYRICELAAETSHPPFKALFAAYDRVLEEQHVEQEHDAVLFRYLMRVGESTRVANQQGREVDLVQRLRSVLEAQGITLLDGGDDITQSVDLSSPDNLAGKKRDRRRVSFDDARIDERWLSEHSESLMAPDPRASGRLLSWPARRSRDSLPGRRARSSSLRSVSDYNEPPQPLLSAQPPQPGADGKINATLLFDLSQTQLEQNADAFLATSELRCVRRALHKWLEATSQLRLAHESARSDAEAHDRRTLLKQAWDQWCSSLQEAIPERRRREELIRQEKRAYRERNKMLLRKALDLWWNKWKRLERDNIIAKEYILMIRYFQRWKAIAVDNRLKNRSILCRKMLSIWRERTTRSLVRNEQGTAHYEEQLLRKSKMQWFWKLCENRISPRHGEWVAKHALQNLTSALHRQRQRQREADELYSPRLTAQALQALEDSMQERREQVMAAEQHYRHMALSKCLTALITQTRLRPVAHEIAQRTDDQRRRKAFQIWRLHASLSREAAAVSQHRILQNAWTNWNDTLRCKALAQKIDERVLLETTYRWVLMERLRLFERTMKDRLAARALATWRSRTGEVVDRLQLAERVFWEGQHTRKLASGFRCLHLAMRRREDAERAAVEFAVSRQCPKFFTILKQRSDHARRLAKWASDARFYFVCSSTLKIWKAKAEEHRQIRRREAYAHVRAGVKMRLAGRCLSNWHAKTTSIQAMDIQAGRREDSRRERLAIQAFATWRERASHVAAMQIRAMTTDRQKLLLSALGVFRLQLEHEAQLAQQASDFRHDTNAAVLEATLKRMQWAQFTAARRVESADALSARNRDAHIRSMLRHWANRTASRRAQHPSTEIHTEAAEPESPSLRPASRALSRSMEAPPASSPPTLTTTTPAYMRTPSRAHRRAGRFRSLPTPAAVTPMTFDPAYLVTNPAPTETRGDEGLTPQVTPFARKLRAGGFTPAGQPPSALRSSLFGRPGGGTNKSVRFGSTSRFSAAGSSNDRSGDTFPDGSGRN